MTTAASLIEREKYTGSDGNEHHSRVATDQVVWTLSATGGKTYMVKFDKNFVKKHLYTSTKKIKLVEAMAQALFEKAGKPSGKTAADYNVEAQEELDNAKFIKQVGHRTKSEQSVCADCGHDKKKHETGSGTPVACKELKTGVPCGCARFVESYARKRSDQNKPVENPLSGATTEKNSVIWMNKVSRADFEKTVIDGIIAKETDLGSNPWNVTGEHVNWDFGAKYKGCVIQIELSKTPALWEQKQGVEVLVIKLPSTDTNKPIYQVLHMHGIF